MAKLSDEELVNKLEQTTGTYCHAEDLDECKAAEVEMKSVHEQILDRMPERMGKVDVAGIAREIVQKLGYVSRSDDFELAQTILRSHLGGKSE